MTTRMSAATWCVAATLLLLAGGCDGLQAPPKAKAKTTMAADRQKAEPAPATTPAPTAAPAPATQAAAKKPGPRDRRDAKDKGATIFSAEEKDRLDAEIANLDKARKDTSSRLQVCEQEQKQGLANHTMEIGKLRQGLVEIDGRYKELVDVRKRVESLEKHNDGNDRAIRELEEQWRKIDQAPKAPPPPPAQKERKEML